MGMALDYQLQACAERAALTTMILADRDGLLVAASPKGEEKNEELAAILPMLIYGSNFAGMLLSKHPGGDQVVVSAFNAAGTDLYLCAIGDFGQQTYEEVTRAKEGVRRILN